MKDISVIIPVYNTPLDKLEKCIESVLKLKNKCDIEVLVIDDGSKEYINKFFNEKFVGEVTYHYKKNGGVSSARNMGLDIATGEFVCFVDSDDVILDYAFDMVGIFDQCDFIIFDIDVIEHQTKITWKVLNQDQGMVEKKDVIEELITSNRMNSPCSKLFLNKYIKQYNLKFDENMVTGEDLNFVIDYTKCVTKIYYVGRSAYCYEREEGTRVARIKKYPNVYFNNISFLRNKLENLIYEYNFNKVYINSLNIDHIEGLYNYVSDLMTLNLFSLDRKKLVNGEITRFMIDCSKCTTKKKLKYYLLKHEKWTLILVLAYMRKLYLDFK